jgi:hypothetical protein
MIWEKPIANFWYDFVQNTMMGDKTAAANAETH